MSNESDHSEDKQVQRESLNLSDEIAAIQEGIDDMNAGRVKSLREFDREFRERMGIPNDP